MIKNKGVITASSFTVMFFIGIGTAIIGAASKNIGLDPSQIGLLIMVQNIGFLFSVVISGTLADTMKKTRLIAAASFVLAAAFFFFYFRGTFLLNFFVMLFIGAGMGVYEGTADPLLLDVQSERQSLYITVNHFFVTFGELMITVYLIFLQMSWRNSLVQSAVAVAAVGLFFLFLRAPEKTTGLISLKDRLVYLGREKGVVLLFFMALFAVGAELGIIGILTSFLMDLRGFTQVTSKLGLVTLLGGIACGRLFLGFVAKKEHLTKIIIFLYGLAAVFMTLLFFVVEGAAAIYVILFLQGVTLSVIFPLIIALAGIKYKEISGTVLGIVKLGIPVGGIVVPFLFSFLSRWVSFSFALLLFPLALVIGLILVLTGIKRLAVS